MAKVQAHLKPWQRKTLIISIAILVILTVFWTLLPTLTKSLANRFLEPYEAHFTASEINPDLFPIGLNLSDVAITQAEQPTLALKKLSIGLDFWPLFTGAFHVNHILVDGFNMQVQQVPEGWVVAGIPTYSTEPATEEEIAPEESQTGGVPPTFFIRNASIKDISVNLTTENGNDAFAINRLNISEVSHELSNWRGIFDLEASINNGKAVLEGDIRADKEKVNAELELGNVRLSSSDVEHFLPAGLGQLSANGLQLEGFTQTTYRFKDSPMLAFTSPLITLKSHDVNIAQNEQDLSWQSLQSDIRDVSVNMINSNTISVEANNSLSVEGLHFATGDQRVDLGKLDLSNDLALDKSGDILRIAKANTKLSLEQSHLKAGDNSVQLSQFESIFSDVTAELSLHNLTGDVSASLDLSANTLVGQLAQGRNFDLNSLKFNAPLSAQLKENNLAVQADQLNLALNNGQFDGDGLTTQLETLSLGLNNTLINQVANDLTISNDEATLSLSNAAFKNNQVDLVSGDFNLGLNKLAFKQTPKALSVTGQSRISSDNLTVQLSQLPNDMPLTTVSYDNLSFNSQLTWQKESEQSELNAQQNSLTLANLGLDQKDALQSLLQSLQLNSDDVTVNLNNNGLEQLAINRNQLAFGPLSSTLANGSSLVNWKDVAINSSNIAMNAAGTSAQVESFMANEFLASKPNSERPQPALAAFEKMSVTNIHLEPKGVTVDTINLDKLIAGITLAEDRSIANLVVPDYLQAKAEQTEVTKETAAQSSTPDKEVPFYAVVHQLKLSPDSQFIFSDNGIKPALSRILDIELLTIENLNTRDPDEQMHVVLKAKNGDYATIDSDVKITPSANRLTMEAQATIREIELPPVSPYVSSALGYQIHSGQLNMDLNLKAKQGVLDGNSHIVLRQFDLGGQTDSNALLKAGAVPLDLAVDALKNRDNNIVLDLPMKGDIDNPDFQWQNFFLLPIRQGLFKASSTYLMQTFIPYANVITLVQFAGEQALRLRVEPLQYALDEENITAPEQEAFLDQMIKLMKDRKGSELKACGVSVVRDINDEITYKQLSEEDRAYLLDLANRRAESLKRYLVDHDIPSSRVFLCSPSIDKDKNALPHVTFTF